jgi:ribosomal protein S18 acetylase RimI-like enzyme
MQHEVRIREMRRADIPRVAEILGRAFATNPIHLAVYREKPMIERRLQVTFEAMFRYGPGRCFVSELDGQILGGMRIVKWPDCQRMGLSVVPAIMKASGGPGPLIREMKHIRVWNRHDPRRPHWHLGPIGVAPEVQHKGIGSHLMEFLCDLTDKDGTEAYLETERSENVPFYQRFGFEVVEDEVVIGIKNWFMLRPAKPYNLTPPCRPEKQ